MQPVGALPVHDRDVGGHRGARPAAVLARGGDRGDAAVAADGSDHRARLRARDRGLSLAAQGGPIARLGLGNGDRVLRADRVPFAAQGHHHRDRRAHAAQPVRPAGGAVLLARGCLRADPRARGDDRRGCHRHRADAAAGGDRLRAGDVQLDGVLGRAVPLRYQPRHHRAGGDADGVALRLPFQPDRPPDAAAERDHRAGVRGARHPALFFAYPDRVGGERCPPGARRIVQPVRHHLAPVAARDRVRSRADARVGLRVDDRTQGGCRNARRGEPGAATRRAGRSRCGRWRGCR